MLVVSLVPPALAWCALALHRAWLDDTTREQRTARRALQRLLAAITRRGGIPTRAELETWRRLVVSLWKIDRAAPSPSEVAAHAGRDLAALWEEAEAALFSLRGGVRDDWVARAMALAREFAAPRPPLPIPRRRRHWLPLATATVLAFGGVKLESAEAPEAASKLAAFLANPRDRTARDEARLALGKIESADPALTRLVEGPWYDRTISRLAVAEWEHLARASAVATSLGFSAAVVLVYFGGRARGRRRATLAVAVVAGGVAIASLAAVQHYGLLAHPQVALVVAPAEVRAIPSDIVARQSAVTLPPGTLVIVERSFLGWERVSTATPGGGWIRAETAGWLYRKRDDTQVSADYAVVRQ